MIIEDPEVVNLRQNLNNKKLLISKNQPEKNVIPGLRLILYRGPGTSVELKELTLDTQCSELKGREVSEIARSYRAL
jgi:hypothetical protein